MLQARKVQQDHRGQRAMMEPMELPARRATLGPPEPQGHRVLPAHKAQRVLTVLTVLMGREYLQVAQLTKCYQSQAAQTTTQRGWTTQVATPLRTREALH